MPPRVEGPHHKVLSSPAQSARSALPSRFVSAGWCRRALVRSGVAFLVVETPRHAPRSRRDAVLASATLGVVASADDARSARAVLPSRSTRAGGSRSPSRTPPSPPRRVPRDGGDAPRILRARLGDLASPSATRSPPASSLPRTTPSSPSCNPVSSSPSPTSRSPPPPSRTPPPTPRVGPHLRATHPPLRRRPSSAPTLFAWSPEELEALQDADAARSPPARRRRRRRSSTRPRAHRRRSTGPPPDRTIAVDPARGRVGVGGGAVVRRTRARSR